MKAKINISNYETYWLEYLNEQLSKEMEEQLFKFLEDNPELYDNLVDDEELKLNAPDIIFEDKEKLYAENQIDNLLIAKLENSISEENNKFITKKIKTDKKIANDYELYKKTKLISDKNIVFPNKNKLKKSVSIPLYQRISAIAALFFILYVAGTYIFIKTENLEIENVRFSELNFQAKPASKNLQDDDIIFIDKIESTAEQTIISEAIIKQEPTKSLDNNYNYEKLERMPIKQAGLIAWSFEKDYNIIEYKEPKRTDVYASQTISFTLEYIEIEQENRLISSLNKIFETGREINIAESIQSLRNKRDELLLSSINK